MMNILGLLMALMLPAILGFSWLHLFWRDSHLAVKIGYGYLLGIFTVTIILQVWNRIGYPLVFSHIAALIALLSIMPFLFKADLSGNSTKSLVYVSFDARWQKIMWGAFLAILAVRYSNIFLEVMWRPLYPWDAWMNWAPKAKTWFELKAIVPFVGESVWTIENSQHNVYTLGNPVAASDYPPLVPLIQTWTALGLGVWIDNVVNIPWVLCAVAVGLAFYGQGRMLGVKPHFAMTAVYLLLSLPYINAHTALAGYADLWLASFYCLAVMAFINWSLTKNKTQAALMLIFSLACIQTKNPGIIWAATLLPAIFLSLLPGRWRYMFLVSALVSCAIWYNIGGFSVNVPGIGLLSITPEFIAIPGIGSFTIEYHQVTEAFVMNGLIWGNWHILGWLVLMLFFPVLVNNIRIMPLLAPSILLLCGILFVYFVFFFTSHHQAAIDNTTINRASIHMLPALIYYVLLFYPHDDRCDILATLNVEKEPVNV